MAEQWYIASKRADFNQIARACHISPVLARIMRNRDLVEPEEMELYLHGTKKDLYNPRLLKDVQKGAEIVKKKIEEGKKIRIISDYDVDGISSNYILFQGLKRCHGKVDYKIPDRIEDGYGINEHLIDQAFQEGIDTILTCDNGIAASAQIAYGNSLGMTVIVTDHHDIPFEKTQEGAINYLLPDAAAVINPKQEDCPYPYKNICGAVVAFKFVQVLYDAFSIKREEADDFLEMAALATVCDVMPLKGENRILVKEGLKRISRTKIPGLRALMKENKLEDKTMTAYHLGFILGPCMNASGRLTTAREALELLLCEEEEACEKKAKALTELNAKRKEMCALGEKEAKNYLETSGHGQDKVLLVFLPDIHESIAGIIAGRIREWYHKPVFVLTRTKQGVKGSGRSIENYHMFQEMTKVKECFEKFGGHPMAAGLTMKEERLEELREKLNQNASLTEKDFVEKVHIDVAMPVSYLTEDFVRELDLLEPFGNGNPKPLFAQKDMYIGGVRELGSTGRCLKLFLKDKEGREIEAIYFGDVEAFFEELKLHFGEETLVRIQKGLSQSVLMDCTYYPQINEWGGRKTMQVVIKNYRFPEGRRLS